MSNQPQQIKSKPDQPEIVETWLNEWATDFDEFLSTEAGKRYLDNLNQDFDSYYCNNSFIW